MREVILVCGSTSASKNNSRARGSAETFREHAPDHGLFLVSTVSVGRGRCLQAMFQMVDVEAAEFALEQLRMRENPIGESTGELGLMGGDDLHVFFSH